VKRTAVAAVCLALAVLAALTAAEKKPAGGKAANEAVEISATAYLDRADIRRLLGRELEETIVVVDVRVVPKPGSLLKVFRDDFELRSYKNGQRSTPFAPSQIAGSSALVISTTGGGGVATQDSGRVWGPPMGGRPRRIGADGTSIGNAGTSTGASAQTGSKGGDKPLLAILEERVLPEKEISEPLAGLLYFYLEGKHKPKDVEFFYSGPAGKLSLKFKE